MKAAIITFLTSASVMTIAAGILLRRGARSKEAESAGTGTVLIGFAALLTLAFFAAYYTQYPQAYAAFFIMLIAACAIAFFASLRM